jgi:hypothetical protein
MGVAGFLLLAKGTFSITSLDLFGLCIGVCIGAALGTMFTHRAKRKQA